MNPPKVLPGLYTVQITYLDGLPLADIPIEAEFFTARTHAGHILRGYARRLDDYTLRCTLLDCDREIVGQATVVKDGATLRGANVTTFVRTEEQKAAFKASQPKINRVDWI